MTEANLINLIAVSIIITIILIGVIIMIKFTRFPRKKKLTFRIVDSKRPSGVFYRVQLKRGIFGWCGFNAYISFDSIGHSSYWGRNREVEEKKIGDYLFLCGRTKTDEDVTIIDKTSGYE